MRKFFETLWDVDWEVGNDIIKFIGNILMYAVIVCIGIQIILILNNIRLLLLALL